MAKKPLSEAEKQTAEAKKKRAKNSPKRVKLAQELASEIDGLRGSLEEMVAAYKLKLDAELVQLSLAAHGQSEPDGKPHLLPVAAAENMLKRLRELDLKPQKGRAKDFQRLQAAVADIIEIVPERK